MLLHKKCSASYIRSLLTHLLCMGDVSPAGLCCFEWWNTLVLPWDKHIWGKFDVLIVFSQGEERAATWMALWQGQPQVCVLCLKMRKHLHHINNHVNLYLESKGDDLCVNQKIYT